MIWQFFALFWLSGFGIGVGVGYTLGRKDEKRETSKKGPWDPV